MKTDEQMVLKIRENLNSLRGKRTQKEVAQALGIKPEVYCRWEKGHSAPSVANVMALARYFKVTPNRILQ